MEEILVFLQLPVLQISSHNHVPSEGISVPINVLDNCIFIFRYGVNKGETLLKLFLIMPYILPKANHIAFAHYPFRIVQDIFRTEHNTFPHTLTIGIFLHSNMFKTIITKSFTVDEVLPKAIKVVVISSYPFIMTAKLEEVIYIFIQLRHFYPKPKLSSMWSIKFQDT